ncbi:unnamed protein product [Trichobilharzia szidati]|nr:unnamed protein product [Trichobilharzia szidati]
MHNQMLEGDDILDPSSTDDSAFVIYARKEVHCDFHDITGYRDSLWFSLPMELEVLQDLSVIEYLRNYVHYTSRKYDLYRRIYNYWCQGSKLPIDRLQNAFEDIIPVQIPNGSCELIFNLIDIQPEDYQTIDFETFCCICAAAERIVFIKLIKDANIPIPPKNITEMIEFQRLQCYYTQINLNDKIKHFLDFLLTWTTTPKRQ